MSALVEFQQLEGEGESRESWAREEWAEIQEKKGFHDRLYHHHDTLHPGNSMLSTGLYSESKKTGCPQSQRPGSLQ